MDKLLQELRMNLENNYKDLAISARKEAETKLQEYLTAGALKPREAEQLKKELSEYSARMQHYSHENISSFLKERL